ncbi:MAG TPA: caspase family protein [Pyrinomonadaceae bacterium]
MRTGITIILIVAAQFLSLPASARERQKAELYVETGPTSAVGTVVFSPDGRTVVIGVGDQTLKLLDVATGKELYTFSPWGQPFTQAAFFAPVDQVVFSPDGRTIAARSQNKIKVWNTASGQEVRSFPVQPEHNSFTADDYIVRCIFSADGTLAATATVKALTLWDIASGRRMHTFSSQDLRNKTANQLGFFPSLFAISLDGKTIAVATDQAIGLWDVASGRQLHILRPPESVVEIVFSPDGRTIASRSMSLQQASPSLTLWDVASGQPLSSASGPHRVAFSPDGKTLAVWCGDNTVRLWDVALRRQLHVLTGHTSFITDFSFSPDGKILVFGSSDQTVKLWDVASGRELRALVGHVGAVTGVAFSSDGKMLASIGASDALGSTHSTVRLWEVSTGRELQTWAGRVRPPIEFVLAPNGSVVAALSLFEKTVRVWDLESAKVLHTFSWEGTPARTEIASLKPYVPPLMKGTPWIAFTQDGRTMASWFDLGKTIKVWDITTGKELHTLSSGENILASVAFSPDGKTVAARSGNGIITLWDVASGEVLRALSLGAGASDLFVFSPDGETIAAVKSGRTISLWSVATGKEFRSLTGHDALITSIAFSSDGARLASGSDDATVKLWEVGSGRVLGTLKGHDTSVYAVAFSQDGGTLASSGLDNMIKLWDTATGRVLKTLQSTDPKTAREVYSVVPDYYRRYQHSAISRLGNFQISLGESGRLNLFDFKSGTLLASLIALEKEEWLVTTPEGRFDTNRTLDRIEGMHWIVNGEISKPVPLDVFMRQYYEPGLLWRTLKCHEGGSCGREFKALPSIADINRVQPKVAIREVKPAAAASVDVVVEAESVTGDVTSGATGRARPKQLSSGVYDLRLFRDGQLVGASTPREKLERFIEDAPRLAARGGVSGTLIDTPEARAWREANDVFQLKSEHVKVISPHRVQYTFRNIKLPRDGRKEVEFTAYAFNSDRVKSTTTEPFKYAVPAAAGGAKKRRAFLISVGVNASENPAYALRYAVNDARKMQEVIGARLKADTSRYSEVIQVQLLSDYDVDKNLAENTARKAIIKGVLSLLAGNEREVSAEVLKQIPGREKIKPVEPEDILIITYSGHGYADQSGIFYLLPYDVGKHTRRLSADTLKRTISSDELSLWMRDITAKEMLLIVDACHSAEAVQGNEFKPGPMGSRGLGQLAYDKGMRILTATQADNVALELEKLQHGLLSYALVREGVEAGRADTEVEFKQLTAVEWLGFAVKAVPQFYADVLAGRMEVLIDGKKAVLGRERRDALTDLSGKQQGTSGVNLQQPTLFDFHRKKTEDVLFNLP